jgi:hypothetical protein
MNVTQWFEPRNRSLQEFLKKHLHPLICWVCWNLFYSAWKSRMFFFCFLHWAYLQTEFLVKLAENCWWCIPIRENCPGHFFSIGGGIHVNLLEKYRWSCSFFSANFLLEGLLAREGIYNWTSRDDLEEQKTPVYRTPEGYAGPPERSLVFHHCTVEKARMSHF